MPRSWRSRAAFAHLLACCFAAAQTFGNSDDNQTGFADSGGFVLDTQDVVNIGFADSGGFVLDTGGDDGTGTTGNDDSDGFTLNTQGDGAAPPIDLNQTGFADSGGFTLDTSNGSATSADSNQSGFTDSGGFSLDTTNPQLGENSGFADSGGFELDTGGHNGGENIGFGDSGGFTLNTQDGTGSGVDLSNTGFADSGGFVLDTQDSESNPNVSPTDIQLTNSTIAENEAPGTFVGEFNATDPDENDVHAFSLVAGEGSTHNHLFTVEASGTLKTDAILDHEANATLSIRVKATDEHNATFEKAFVINVSDVNEAPVVEAPSGTGTESDPYLIATVGNLYWLSQTSSVWSKHFLQTADINASGTSLLDNGAGIATIGGSTIFSGTYDGGGHLIDGLTINRSVNGCRGHVWTDVECGD